jgi:hypothetical protein
VELTEVAAAMVVEKVAATAVGVTAVEVGYSLSCFSSRTWKYHMISMTFSIGGCNMLRTRIE